MEYWAANVRRVAIFMCALTVLAWTSESQGAVAPLPSWTNPVVAGDFPDPGAIYDSGQFWVATTASPAGLFPVLRSGDLRTWVLTGAAFSSPPEWASGSFWAPALSRAGGQVLMYYSAREISGRHCLAVATAPTPAGPYADRGPLVCQGVGSIDPAVAVIDGRRWLLWKEDGNSVGLPTAILAIRISDDGTRLIGTRRRLLTNRGGWEGSIVEAPDLISHGGRLYLFYSANVCCGSSCRYGVGVARARSIWGPWRRNPGNPILAGNRTWRCPGHPTAIRGPHGDWYLLYHAYPRASGLRIRELLLDRVRWRHGWPQVNRGRGPGSVTESAHPRAPARSASRRPPPRP
jgi:xylan 1,4-beta-xylosidase